MDPSSRSSTAVICLGAHRPEIGIVTQSMLPQHEYTIEGPCSEHFLIMTISGIFKQLPFAHGFCDFCFTFASQFFQQWLYECQQFG